MPQRFAIVEALAEVQHEVLSAERHVEPVCVAAWARHTWLVRHGGAGEQQTRRRKPGGDVRYGRRDLARRWRGCHCGGVFNVTLSHSAVTSIRWRASLR